MFKLYCIASRSRKSCRIVFLFTHKNGDFGEISVRERGCAAPISKVTYRIGFCAILWCSVNSYSDRRRSNLVRSRTGTHRDGSKYSGERTGIKCTKPSRSTAPARRSMCVNDLFRPGPLLFMLYRIETRKAIPHSVNTT